MAFFSLTDIKYVPGQDRQFEVNTDQFNIDNKRYPIDIGSADKAHYMMFFVNVQERTQVGGYNYDSTTSAKVLENMSGSQNGFSVSRDLLNQGIDYLNNLNTQTDTSISDMQYNTEDVADDGTTAGIVKQIQSTNVLSKIGQAAKSFKDTDFLKRGNFFRTVKRTKDTIALYMPDTLAFDYRQSYSDVSVTKDLGDFGLAVQAGASLLDKRNTSSNQAIMQNLSPFLADFAKSRGIGGDSTFTAFTAATGGVLATNPQLELIYQSPSFRNFRFSFMFYPRSQKEAKQVLGIIDMFRFHQAPEVLTSTYGRFLVPPSEFDIKFYYNGQENPNIPQISTCVLTDISVDYAPSGFASYETLSNKPERGGTGMPVAIRMDLAFKETEIITKQFLSGEKRSYASVFNGNEPINGLDIGGEMRTQEQLDYAASLGDWDETNPNYGLTQENTATSDTEFDLVNGDWGSDNSISVEEDGEAGA
jgi:hypothetical protein